MHGLGDYGHVFRFEASISAVKQYLAIFLAVFSGDGNTIRLKIWGNRMRLSILLNWQRLVTR